MLTTRNLTNGSLGVGRLPASAGNWFAQRLCSDSRNVRKRHQIFVDTGGRFVYLTLSLFPGCRVRMPSPPM